MKKLATLHTARLSLVVVATAIILGAFFLGSTRASASVSMSDSVGDAAGYYDCF